MILKDTVSRDRSGPGRLFAGGPVGLKGFETMRFVSKYGQQFWLHNVAFTWVAPEH